MDLALLKLVDLDILYLEVGRFEVSALRGDILGAAAKSSRSLAASIPLTSLASDTAEVNVQNHLHILKGLVDVTLADHIRRLAPCRIGSRLAV